jgi:hypothetical protein
MHQPREGVDRMMHRREELKDGTTVDEDQRATGDDHLDEFGLLP